jgi:hypothetical protein
MNKLMATKAVSPDEMKYKAQDALHTLKRAEEIRADKALMKHVKKHAAAEMKAIAKVAAGKPRGKR